MNVMPGRALIKANSFPGWMTGTALHSAASGRHGRGSNCQVPPDDLLVQVGDGSGRDDAAPIHHVEFVRYLDTEVKILLEKFLHKEGPDPYWVLSQQGVVTVEPDSRDLPDEPHKEKIRGVPPFPPLSRERLPLMDLVYPNHLSRGYDYKKKKR